MKLLGQRSSKPTALIADSDGSVIDLPGLGALGRSGKTLRIPNPDEIIPLPEGAHLYLLPDRVPLAAKKGQPVQTKGLPVAAILPQGYTRALLPAYEHAGATSWLPYFGYSACFFQEDKIHVAALATQPDLKWNPKSFNDRLLKKKIKKKLSANPENRVLSQLARCAAEYRCYTAANIFFERWEGALPVSPACNSACRGCISKAEDPGPPSPQERFDFVPTLKECVEVARGHFENAEEPIVSFGQGCEGEPSLQSNLIEQIIRTLRSEFPDAQFHINTNGSRPGEMKRLCEAGLDSLRVSLNSAQENWYHAYYRPKNYSFDDLRQTIRVAKSHGKFVSLNLLCFPGVTDDPRETEFFFRFLEELKPDLIQLRNLNIDPWRYLRECIGENAAGIGMANWITQVKQAFPSIRIGNFTPYIRKAL